VVAPGVISGRAGVEVLRRWMQLAMPLSAGRIDKAVFLGVPIDSRRSLVAWYLNANPALDETVHQEHWEFADVDFERGTIRGGYAQ